jgi:hypothetical protein
MADIDHASPMAPEMDGAGGDGNQEVFDMNAYRSNFAKMDKIRSFMGIASGCVAGVCGLTGLAGLGECFLCATLLSYGSHKLPPCSCSFSFYRVSCCDVTIMYIDMAVCFLVLHISVNLSLLGFKMNFDLHSYSRETMLAFLTADLQKCAMSFMLFWTLFYGLVYLF